MERCNTCPHWVELRETGVWGAYAEPDARGCKLTYNDIQTPHNPALKHWATNDDGAPNILVTAPDFGCTEHPGNR